MSAQSLVTKMCRIEKNIILTCYLQIAMNSKSILAFELNKSFVLNLGYDTFTKLRETSNADDIYCRCLVLLAD